MSPTTAAVQPGETRQAQHYWGLRGIDWAGSRGESCNAGRVHIAGWHQGDLAEYLVNFPSSSQSYTLNVIGLPDDPNPVQVNVYIDGSYYGQISWNDGNPVCNENDGGSSQKIEIRGYQGVHGIAFQFANDWSKTCSPWQDSCDRNFFKCPQCGDFNATAMADIPQEQWPDFVPADKLAELKMQYNTAMKKL